MTSKGRHRNAILMLVVANLFWGVSFPAAKALLLVNERLAPGAGAFAVSWALAPRFVLAAAVLALLVLGSRLHPTRAEWIHGFALGVGSTAGMLLQTDGLRFTAASTSAFLTQLYAIMIPIWVAFRTGRNPGTVVWASCVLVMVGVAILGHFDWRTLRFGRGEWETLLCSFFFMAVILRIGSREAGSNRPAVFTMVMFATEGVVFAGMAAWTAPSRAALLVPLTSAGWVAITLIITVFCTLVAFLIMNSFQPAITAIEAGLIYCLEPIFGSVFALFLPARLSQWGGVAYSNEHPTSSLLIGGALVTAANLLIQMGARPADP